MPSNNDVTPRLFITASAWRTVPVGEDELAAGQIGDGLHECSIRLHG